MRSIPAYAHAAFLEFVSAHAAKGDPDAQRLMGRLPKRGIPKPKTGRTRPSRAEAVAQLRAAVMERAGERCEVCGREGFVLELHHLVGGGLRRHRESVETLVGACADCHRAMHRGDVGTLRAAKETCIRLGLHAGFAAVDRRLQKIEEARR